VAFIHSITDAEADDRVAAFFEHDRQTLGFVANHSRVLGHRPDLFAAWGKLIGAIKATMDQRRYELATIAAARRLGSSYCMLAHGKVLLDLFMDAGTLRDVALDHRTAGLDAVDVAVMDLADKVAANAGGVNEEDIGRLRALGLSDADILDVVTAAAARCFFSKVLDATGTQADAAYTAMEPNVRDALTVGRPIAES
jgi:uncharacterized peroxidase-related enzyme